MNSFQGVEVINNVFKVEMEGKTRLFTRSAYPSHYGERKIGDYREWLPSRSKLASIILKGYVPGIKKDTRLLYLGAATGTTASHVSDIVDGGVIYAVEYSAKPFQKFLRLAMERKNIIPIFADAGNPERYSGIVEKVDFIYQDIAQRNQVGIFVRNFEFFGKSGAEGIMCVKAKSIDSTADPDEIYRKVIESLESRFEIMEWNELEPYHRDHIFISVRWKG